jgi:hypothetical protein
MTDIKELLALAEIKKLNRGDRTDDKWLGDPFHDKNRHWERSTPWR